MPASVSMERASAYLKQVDSRGRSLYEHLANLLEMIDNQQTNQSINQLMDLEKLSIQAKMRSNVVEQPVNQSINQTVSQSINQSINPTWLKSQSKLMESMIATTHTEYQSINQPINQTINKTINRTKAPLIDFRVQNIQSISHIISQSGLMVDCVAVQLALNQLAINLSINQSIQKSVGLPINNLSFWGVIRGLTSDYYVMECVLKPSNQQSINQSINQSIKSSKKAFVDQSEVRGAGVNRSIYFVSNTLVVSSDQISQLANPSVNQINQSCWTLLPDARAELLIKSRKFHRFMSGKLDAPITGNPSFTQTKSDTNQSINASEALFLRCQIARIQHSAFVAPKGAYTSVELEGNEELNQPNNQTSEYVDIDAAFEGSDASINQLDSWTHVRGKLLRGGRTTQWVAPEVEEEEEAEPEADPAANQEEEEEEEVPALLSTIDNDHLEGSEAPLFTIRSINQLANQARHPHGVTTVHSILWPGAYSINQGKQTVNLYVGYGVKRQARPFVPALMPAISSEFNEMSVDEEDQPINQLAEQVDPVLTVELQEDEENNEDEEEGDEEDEDQ